VIGIDIGIRIDIGIGVGIGIGIGLYELVYTTKLICLNNLLEETDDGKGLKYISQHRTVKCFGSVEGTHVRSGPLREPF
jgi:hypothetical protein